VDIVTVSFSEGHILALSVAVFRYKHYHFDVPISSPFPLFSYNDTLCVVDETEHLQIDLSVSRCECARHSMTVDVVILLFAIVILNLCRGLYVVAIS